MSDPTEEGRKTQRLFLGFPVPRETGGLLHGWCLTELAKLGGKLVSPENLHVTLMYFGELEPEAAEAVKSLVESTTFSSLRVRTGRLCKLGRDALALNLMTNTESLEELRRRMSAGPLHELAGFMAHPPRNLRLHVTLMRSKSLPPNVSVSPPKVEFVLNRLTLFESVLAPTGATYRPVTDASIT